MVFDLGFFLLSKRSFVGNSVANPDGFQIAISASELIAQHGKRVPSAQDSQKEFKALTVILSTSALEWKKIDSINKDLENF